MALFRKSKIKARRFAIAQAMIRARLALQKGVDVESIVIRALLMPGDFGRLDGESLLDMVARSRELERGDLRELLRALQDEGLDPAKIKYLSIPPDIFVDIAGILLVLLDDETRVAA